ncbi:mutS protein homolog 5 isoform X6 [Alosa alosa]|uniref:mutS protein homolog 5 isoform X6 n=1 Tax=Alosa alosa TaxID=278164 RepID=UPI0020150676|nr:mutS protein homolog 5 isoform X6 [Alosa alosa]
MISAGQREKPEIRQGMDIATGAEERVITPQATSFQGDEDEEESPGVYLSVLAQKEQVGLSFYDSRDYVLHYMPDVADNNLQILSKVIQEVSPKVIITSAKQEYSIAQFIKNLGCNPDYKPEVVVYLNSDFGRTCNATSGALISAISGPEVGKQRLLAANLPFLSPAMTEKEKMSFLSSCLSFDSVLMLRTVGALLKCLDRRRVGVELEDSSVGVPILQFRMYTLNDMVYIDRDTYSVLQIFKSELHPSVYKLQSGEKEGLSLFGILNRCKSKFGSKLLRKWFLQPTRDITVLHRRQEVVQFFTTPRNLDTFRILQSCLRNIRSIPTLLHRMALSHTKVNDWQSLYKVDFESSVAENRFTIKPNVDPAVDEKKRRMMGLPDFLTEVARTELEHLDSRIPSCCVIYIPLIGFLLSIPRLPSMVQKEDFEIDGLDFMFLSGERLHYRSEKTKGLDDLLGDLHCDIRDLETSVMTQLQNVVLQRSSCLYKVLSLCAELDCLIAMALASQEYIYSCPTVMPHSSIRLSQSRHPLLELCCPVFVSNPLVSSDTEGKVKVLTGPNSSGKSIYLKQVGLIVFMALIGSDVPAKEAEIGLVDGIFTRMQSRESVSVGLSTFMIDLNQMAYALKGSTGNSLVLIDEFGKGTNTVDGLSLLAACISDWLNRSADQCPHVLLATNFHSLLQLDLLPSSPLLSLLTFETAIDGEDLVFLYQLKEGICQSSYAANIAKLAGVPTELVHRGIEVSELYRTGKTIKRIDRPTNDQHNIKCHSMVEKFLSLDLEDPSLDLQHYMKEVVLPVSEY